MAATDAPDLIMDPAPALNRVRMEAGAIGDTIGLEDSRGRYDGHFC